MHVSAADLPPGEPAQGISRVLALWRGNQYSDVRYSLDLATVAPFHELSGSVEIALTVREPAPDIVLDWRPHQADTSLPLARIVEVSVNDLPVTPRFVPDHLVISNAYVNAGRNVVRIAFTSPVGVSGTAVTRYHDGDDGAEYLYSLFVPADASSVFPCFDQPDLKARFALTLSIPASWTAISNSPANAVESNGERATFRFPPTAPISTYVFAFAAGPFAHMRDDASETRLLVRKSRLARAAAAAPEVLKLNREAVRWFSEYFCSAFPFEKYDLVLIPEFPYGGMEHAGATFLREDSVLFPFEPSAADRLRRAQLIFHEAAHQWFGDLVTMRWFDDLWLKEGFANFMAAKATDALLPEFSARNAFRALKNSAYRTDATGGTTPIRQELVNLGAAKSAYGSIVYSKAPAVLDQLEFYLGEEMFREGTREFLRAHAFSVADWSALIGAYEGVSGRDLSAWAQAWVARRGMPIVRTRVRSDAAGTIEALMLEQRDVLEEGGLWPQRVQVLLLDQDGRQTVLQVLVEGASTRAPEAAGLPKPWLIYSNYGDRGYGRFLLDDASTNAALAGLSTIRQPLLRAQLWDALWEGVRVAELEPNRWLEAVLRHLPAETDEVTVAGLLARLQTAFRYYLTDAQRQAIAPALDVVLRAGMFESPALGLRVTYFRGFASVAFTDAARVDLKALLANATTIPGVTLTSSDRFRIIRRLLVLEDADAEMWLASQSQADQSDDGRRFGFAAEAARPDAANKGRYVDRFLHDRQLPERWIEEALFPLNAVEHADLTLPQLDAALAAVPEMGRRHKIFFVNDWIDAFLGGQRSASALALVQRFAASPDLAPEVRRKVLEALDELGRTVRIRAGR